MVLSTILATLKGVLANKYIVGAILISLIVGGSFFYGKHITETQKELEIKVLKSEFEELLTKKEKEVSDWKAAAADVKIVEVIRWKERNVYIEKNKDEVDSRIEEELKDENQTCIIGPNFIGLHNDAARPSNGSNTAN